MGELIFIDVAAKRKDGNVQAAWDRYLAAREMAERSRDVSDGIAAGKAWREFLDLFAGKK